MSSDVTELIRDSLPLVGVVVGGLLGAWFNSSGDTKRWRREFTVDTYREQRDFIGQMLIAVNTLHILLHHLGSALQGGSAPADLLERLGPATEEWRRMLALMGTAAQPGIQEAMSQYDQCRAEVAEAVNAKNASQIQSALASTDNAYTTLLTAVKTAQEAMVGHVARHVLPRRTRLWRTLRKQSLDYL
jgi:hypothetical protein